MNCLANTESWKSAESLGISFSTKLEQSLDLIGRVHMHVLHSSGFIFPLFKVEIYCREDCPKYHLWLKCVHILFLA